MRTQKSPARSILIVEDDSLQLERYLQLARSSSCYAVGASTRDAALIILERETFHFLLTDIHLTGTNADGLTILRYVMENAPQTVPLAMTADPTLENYERVMSMGVAYLFRKPIISRDELLIHIDAAHHRMPATVTARTK